MVIFSTEESEMSSKSESFKTDDDYASDDTENDPSFSLLEETRSQLSKISLKKTRPSVVSSVCRKLDVGSDNELDEVGDVEVPQLNAKDAKTFEDIEKMINDGLLEKLKVDQCKIYLRKHGLRLTGKKDTLVGRIKEHLEVIGGGGEKKYPMSSFVMNCQGDACTGDVVMFEQKVYEMFSIASRSATGPPCGIRTVAGRIVKESYGAAKQQHTFTIEVLWSKGEKPLPPLYPLLIKGRNLYRLKTARQPWTDENARSKVLLEKHQRGSLARTSRGIRIQKKEMRMNHVKRSENKNSKNCQLPANPSNQAAQQLHGRQQHMDLPIPQAKPLSQQKHATSQLFNTISSERLKEANGDLVSSNIKQGSYSSSSQVSGAVHAVKPWTLGPLQPQNHAYIPRLETWEEAFHMNSNSSQYQQFSTHVSTPKIAHPGRHHHGGSALQIQRPVCSYYLQGRCYYMENCKFSHTKENL